VNFFKEGRVDAMTKREEPPLWFVYRRIWTLNSSSMILSVVSLVTDLSCQ